MLLSAVSEAALRSSRTNIETSSLSEMNWLTADCYHVDGMKFTGLITDQIRDALLKLQGDTVFPVTMTSETSYSMSCPQL